MRLTLSLLVCSIVLVLPGAAAAHSTVNGANGEVVYTTEDVTSANCLVVRNLGVDIKFVDKLPGRKCVDFGMNASGDCRADGEPDADGFFYEASCPRANKGLVRIDVGDREDTVVTTGLDLPVQVLAGNGADTVTTGALNDVVLGGSGNDSIDGGAGNDLVKDEDGDDIVKAGAGNDQIQGGLGADTIDAGDGDDDIKVRDGIADTVVCGAGTDKVDADTLDKVEGDCENVARTQTAPPKGADSTAGDIKAPKLLVGALTLQRVGKKRKLYIQATSSEKGTLAASGRLEVGGLNLALRSKVYSLKVGGGGVEIVIALSKSQMKLLDTAFRKRRSAVAKIDVVATDLAGNSATRKAPRIKLAR